MNMEAFGAWALHPASTTHPKPCQGLGLPPQGRQSEEKEPSGACCPDPHVRASSFLEPNCL